MIVAILLAAGNARRFDGSQKLLAMVPYEQQRVPLVRASTLALLSVGLERLIVVLGRDADRVRAALEGLPLSFAVNGEYQSGMSTSLRTGIAAASQLWPDSQGLLVALGDQPLGDKATGLVGQLMTTFTGQGPLCTHSVAAPRFRGAPGNPVIFGKELVSELLAVTGDRGARSVVERDAARVRYVDFDCDPPPDIDTIEDLANLGAQVSKP